mgnify:CR=1 FL=1
MKKFFLALTLLCTVFTFSAFANDVKVSNKVLSAFEVSFNKASNVKWAKVKSLYQAQFTMDNEQYSAYFDADGAMVVVARFITVGQLPLSLKTALKEEAGNNEVAYLFELSDEEGVHYYATIEKEGKKKMLRSMGNKKWVPYSKVKI